MKKSICLIVFIVITNICYAQFNLNELPKITMDQYSDKLMHYFENKNDDIIFETISVYKDEANASILQAIDSQLIFFFCGISVDDINRFNKFFDVVKESNIARLAEIFELVKNIDILEYLEEQEPSPDLNDAYWLLFFSTGGNIYLDKIYLIIKNNISETNNAQYYLTVRSGMWSIASNIRYFAQIQKHFQMTTILDNDTKKYITDTDPETILSDTQQFIWAKRESGDW